MDPNQPNFQQFMQNLNNNMPNQNLDMNQMNMFYNQMMNNPMMMNNFMNSFNNMNQMGNNNFNNINMANLNNQMMMNLMIQMMNMNPMLFMALLQNMMNTQSPTNVNDNNYYINLFFVVENSYRISIAVRPNESLSSAITKFINKSGNTSINYYLFNGKRLSESLTIEQQGLHDGNEIYVINAGNVLGAH